MAWRRPGDKPLSEAMMVNLLTHICVARPQWVNSDKCSRYRWMRFWIHTTYSLSQEIFSISPWQKVEDKLTKLAFANYKKCKYILCFLSQIQFNKGYFHCLLVVFQEAAYTWRTSLYLVASASAEFFADIALCPFEAVKVRIQTQPGFAGTLREGMPKLFAEEGVFGWGVAYILQCHYNTVDFLSNTKNTL